MQTHPSLLGASARFAAAAIALTRNRDSGRDVVTPKLDEFLRVLAGQNEWRVFVDGTRNLGHQAATVTIMRRLIDLSNFRGRVLVVYTDYGRALLGCTADKLAMMFTGVDPTHLPDAMSSYGACTEIRFLPFERRAELREPFDFGFTGGADDMTVNYARELNVHFFARIQPYMWDDPPSAHLDEFYEASRIEQPDGRHLYLLEAYPEAGLLPIQMPTSAAAGIPPAIWRWYSEGQAFDSGLANRTRNLRAVLDARRRAGTNLVLWPLYGLQHFSDSAAEMLLLCMRASLRCAGSLGRRVVICSFNPSEELPGLAEALAVAATDPRIRIHRAHGPQFANWLDVSRNVAAALAADGDALVHFVEIGIVPMDVFQYCVATADLPSLIEGQATSNWLTGLGKPFLQLLRRDHAIKNGYAAPDPAAQRTSEDIAAMAAELRDQFSVARASTERVWVHCAAVDQLARYLCDGCDNTSAVVRYFQSVREHFASPARDKLIVGLLALREVVLASEESSV